ncbi:hypothetical protein COB64_00295 [Candidatus Wolfebacteria bacterium]|nr:MAG: hypothetical protein COB64_00295 [Candidatus Wolfebacteria bacterium]
MSKFLHYFAMMIILLGGIALLVLSVIWFIQGILLMGIGMLIMGLVALSNYFLHVQSMKMKDENRG